MTTLSIYEAQQKVIDHFAFFDDWEDRYRYLIDLGRKLPDFPSQWQTEDFRIRGCQSQVWFHPEWRDQRLYFQATSDAAIVSGLIYLLLDIYSGRTPQEILASQPEFIEKIGFTQFLSPTRSNGLAHMLTAIQRYATQYQSTHY
ncbi:MAG: SufE family protein [Legionellales bacterium]|nr:SufE family protein [Legionellales bacterium]